MTDRFTREEFADELEDRGSPLCDCDDPAGGPPANPHTGVRMDHHCDCAAVRASVMIRRGESITRHGRECGCLIEDNAAGKEAAFAPPPRHEGDVSDLPDPMFTSWDDFLKQVPQGAVNAWCEQKANVADRRRRRSGAGGRRISTRDVLAVLTAAQGCCFHCGSLALEKRPSDPATGAPLPWLDVARRIGVLDHDLSRVGGGMDAGLVWSCLWCNTSVSERRPGATDHGAILEARES